MTGLRWANYDKSMIKTYNVHEAKSNLSRILEAVTAGERVIIARNGVPVVEVVQHVPAKKFVIGCLKDEFSELTPEDEAILFARGPYESRLPDEMFDEVDEQATLERPAR